MEKEINNPDKENTLKILRTFQNDYNKAVSSSSPEKETIPIDTSPKKPIEIPKEKQQIETPKPSEPQQREEVYSKLSINSLDKKTEKSDGIPGLPDIVSLPKEKKQKKDYSTIAGLPDENIKQPTQSPTTLKTDKPQTRMSNIRTANYDAKVALKDKDSEVLSKSLYLDQQKKPAEDKKKLKKEITSIYKEYKKIEEDKSKLSTIQDEQEKRAEKLIIKKKEKDLKTQKSILTEKEFGYHWSPLEQKKNNNFIFLGIAISLLIISLGGVTWFFFFNEKKDNIEKDAEITIEKPKTKDTILSASIVEKVDVTHGDIDLLKSLRSVRKVNTLVRVIPTANEEILSAYQFTQRFTQAPEFFLDALGDNMFLGTFQTKRDNGLIFILSVDIYVNAHSSILKWENNNKLVENLERITGLKFRAPLLPPTILSRSGFTDGSVQNVTVRHLYDSDQKIRVIYGFLNINTLVIATTRAAFEKAVSEIRNKGGSLF